MKGKIALGTLLIIVVCFLAKCNSKDEVVNGQSILVGKATILVDETLLPIVEDQVAVFESEYDAKITLVAKSEGEALQALTRDSAKIIILSRKLTEKETSFFERKKIFPKVTMFATDAIAFIANESTADSLIALQDVIQFMKGSSNNPKIKGLVFDNPNSSTARYMNSLAGLSATPDTNIFSFKSNEEVINFVSKNEGMIGIIGLNWLAQPSTEMQAVTESVKILSVKGFKGPEYYYPSQNNLAEGKYPLARDLYIVNAQGFAGLGIGFASFIAGERGQRIILKSGLLPIRIPGRKILIKDQNQTKDNN